MSVKLEINDPIKVNDGEKRGFKIAYLIIIPLVSVIISALTIYQSDIYNKREDAARAREVKLYNEQIGVYKEQIGIYKEEIKELKKNNALKLISEIGELSSKNLDSAIVISSGLSDLKGDYTEPAIKRAINKMNGDMIIRNRNQLKKYITQLFDNNKSIRINAVSNMVDLINENNVESCVDIMYETTEFYETNDKSKLDSGLYNELYVLFLVDYTAFSTEKIRNKTNKLLDKIENLSGSSESKKDFIKRIRSELEKAS